MSTEELDYAESDDGSFYTGATNSIDLTEFENDNISNVVASDIFINDFNPLMEEGSPDIKSIARNAKIGEIKDQFKGNVTTGTYTKISIKVYIIIMFMFINMHVLLITYLFNK